MESRDILADKMNIGGPEFFEERIILGTVAEGCDIVGERIKPDIDYVIRIDGNGNSPFECGS